MASVDEERGGASFRFPSPPSRRSRSRRHSNASPSSLAGSYDIVCNEADSTAANGKTMSAPTAVFNLASAVVGAGIMALPNAFRVLGVLGGVLTLFVMHG